MFSYVSTSDGTGVDVTDNNITLDLAAAGLNLELAAGTYWVGVAPTLPSTARWNWSQGVVSDTDAQLFDEGNFGGFDWTSIVSLIADWGDLALRVEGEVLVANTCDTANDISWLTPSATSGTVAPAASEDVIIAVDPTGLTVGDTYTGTLCVRSNSAGNNRAPIQVPVSLTVEPPTAVTMQQPVAATINRQMMVAALTTTLLAITAAYVIKRKRS